MFLPNHVYICNPEPISCIHLWLMFFLALIKFVVIYFFWTVTNRDSVFPLQVSSLQPCPYNCFSWNIWWLTLFSSGTTAFFLRPPFPTAAYYNSSYNNSLSLNCYPMFIYVKTMCLATIWFCNVKLSSHMN